MLHEHIVYFLFQWGQGFVDALIELIVILDTPLCELPISGAVADFVLAGLRIADYSIIDLLLGPGLAILLYLTIWNLCRGK